MKSSTIQVIVTGIFILFALVGVLVFSVSSTKTKSENQNVKVTIWGTLPESYFMPVIFELNTKYPGYVNMDYIYKEEKILERDLTNALLDNKEIPDGLLISHDLLLKYQKRLTLISWNALSERVYKDTYSEASEIFLTQSGSYAVPFLIDPLVLYWNRDSFSAQGIASAPSKWEEITNLTPRLTERNENRTLKKVAIGLGEFQNIKYAKEILAALSLQVGGKFVSRNNDSLQQSVQQDAEDGSELPLTNALTFFTQFANPSKETYTWSKALPNDESMFLRGDSAMFIGFGSEVGSLRSKNPNLNFDIAVLPQAKSGEKPLTYGTIYGIGILQDSLNKNSMLQMANFLASAELQKAIAEKGALAPVRKDLLQTPPGTAVGDVVWQSAFITRGWLDPNKLETDSLFKELIESVTTGRTTPSQSAIIFAEQLKEILNVYNK